MPDVESKKKKMEKTHISFTCFYAKVRTAGPFNLGKKTSFKSSLLSFFCLLG